MTKKTLIASCLFFIGVICSAQVTTKDSSTRDMDGISELAMDSTFDIDEFLSSMDLFLDSLLRPRSYIGGNAGISKGFFQYSNANHTRIVTRERMLFSPSIGYYHKAGPGLTLAGTIMYQNGKPLNLYQYSISPSFDLLRHRAWTAGVSYVRYFTRDSLQFYASPLQNEVNAYFLWRKPFIQVGVAGNYGWGSRTEYLKRQHFIRLLLLRRLGSVTTVRETEESISDFSLTASLRHNFYWLKLFSRKDYLRFTPMLTFSAGTQKFGFNQSTGTTATIIRTGANVSYNSGKISIEQNQKFEPLSLTLYLRPEYSFGKFYIQPQVMFDYYFPASEEKLSTLFSLNAGFLF